MSHVVHLPRWGRRVQRAKETTERITESLEEKERSFDDTRVRVLVASQRAERAAVTMIQRQERLAQTVARHGR